MKNYTIMKKSSLILFVIAFCVNASAQQAGTLNNQFSQDGWDTSIFGNNNGFKITKTIIQPDGKILACAEAYFPSEATQAIIVRYNTDGSLDTSFGGGDGVVRTKDDPTIDLWFNGENMALQSTGKMIIIGDVFTNTERIVRLNADGSLDDSFGINGIVDNNRQNAELFRHVGIQSDDKIIICGTERRLVNGVFKEHVFLWRFSSNGLRDNSFGSSGVVSYYSSDWNSGANLWINDVIILPDDKILINQSFSAVSTNCVMVKKLNANGSVDSSFGTNGEFIKTVVDNTPLSNKFSNSAVQQNGSIISSIILSTQEEQLHSDSMFRINAQGQIDSSFSIIQEEQSSSTTELQLKISGNKLYTIKKASGTNYGFDQINCYDLAGNLVSDFGNDGIAIINQNDVPQSMLSKAAISPNGNIYLVSHIPDPNN